MNATVTQSSTFNSIAQLSHLSGFPIRLFREGALIFPPDAGKTEDIFLCDPDLFPWLCSHEPSVVMDKDFQDIFYGKAQCGDFVCVVGPLKWETLFPDRHREYLRLHQVNNGPMMNIPTGSFAKLNDVLQLAVSLLCAGTESVLAVHAEQRKATTDSTSKIAVMDFQAGKRLNDEAEGGVHHTPYELESRALKALEDGNEEEFFRLLGELQSYSGGSFAVNRTKYLEYSAVSMVTLLTRAAIRGGVPQKEAYAVSDLLLSRASKGTSEQAHFQVLQDGIAQFFRLVKKYKNMSHHSYHIRKCKAYIAANLNQPLSPEILAGEMELNKNYLMTLFSSYEGESLMQYVQRKRILTAADLLKYSDQSILQIATYYQFQTQSHFGVAFKKVMGMSPAVYRKKYKPVG